DARRLARKGLGFVTEAPNQHAQSEDEEDVPDDGPGQRGFHDLRKAARQSEDRDDEFRRVPERRVQEASDPRARMLPQLLRREPKEPGERDDREARNEEHDDILAE